MKNNQVSFNKYVRVNDRDIYLAIREGLRPMQTIFDHTHNGLPFFGNEMAGAEKIGNTHNDFFSLSHIPGRWLDALLNAQQIPGIIIDEKAVENLTNWAYSSVEEGGTGLPTRIDLKTFLIDKQCLMHNLREVMHAFYALYKYRNDERAKNLAIRVIETINRYYIEKGFVFDEAGFFSDTGGTVTGVHPFPLSFGRYIGSLVKFYRASGYTPALTQAIKLKDYCTEHVLTGDAEYNIEKLGDHTHSVTSMLSSLAMLGEETRDINVLKIVEMFMNRGLKKCTLDFGWCLVGYERDNLMGEINNTADIMETCLILAKAGFAGYYERAERILRAHFLPSQLLDTCFIPPITDINDINYMLHENAVGAFGFPCPYGHEYEPGSRIPFNWDVVGGAISGLCVAYNSIISKNEHGLDINMLFSINHEDIEIVDAYYDKTLKLYAKKDISHLTVRLPDTFEIKSIIPSSVNWKVVDKKVVFTDIKQGDKLAIELNMIRYAITYAFRDHTLQAEWEGESITAMTSPGKRLCFFPEIKPDNDVIKQKKL